MIEIALALYLILTVYVFFVLIYQIGYKRNKLIFVNKKLRLYFFTFVVFLYAMYIEPNMIVIRETPIEVWFDAKIVVLSDIHLWEVKKSQFLQRVVDKVNLQKDIDFVVIAGDFTFLRDKKPNLDHLFFPLRDIKVPIYAVLWNHDTKNPGPDIEKALIASLKKYKVQLLDNEKTIFSKKNIHILWLWDNWIPNDKVEMIHDYKKEDNLIVIAHNPDTLLKYKNTIPDITISGHTHGWQLRIPYLYKAVIPCVASFDRWLEMYNENKVFISSGLGEVGLPMRILNPPVIDILDFN